MGAEFSQSVSQRLERFADELTPDAYEAILSGVAMAYGVHRRTADPGTAVDLNEVQRLMKEFAGELRKLDEALETLSAYVTRLRTQTQERSPSVGRSRILH